MSATSKRHNQESDVPPRRRASGALLRCSILVAALSITALFISRSNELNSHSYALCSPHDSQNIFTVDSVNSRVQCILVDKSQITRTGTLEHILHHRQGSMPVLNLLNKLRAPLAVRYIPLGAIVVPGLSDSHAHILEYGSTLQLPLEGTKTVNETVARVRNYILSNTDVHSNTSLWIHAQGWDHTAWPSQAWPTAVRQIILVKSPRDDSNSSSFFLQADLDSDPIIRGRPVVLQSKDCHALWVSQRALEFSLPFPEEVEGGVIIRDASGNPTGTLGPVSFGVIVLLTTSHDTGMLLDNAQELVKQPKLLENDLAKRFNSTIQEAVKYGLTSIHDAGLDPISLKFFKEEAQRKTLPIRIYGMTYFDENGEYWGNTTKPLIATGDERLTARSVKIFADGALRTGGAALHEPYADNPITNGFMRLDKEVLFKYIPLFLRDGWQVNVHAIGDRANGIVLDAFEASLTGQTCSGLEGSESLQASSPLMRKLTAQLPFNVTLTLYPNSISDMLYAEDRLGPERVKNLYAFRTLIESGARITLGSDAPVESLNPLSGFYAAVSRLTPQGDSPHGPDGWFPDQRLTREEALRGMTIDPAYASFTESILGSLEVGKRADYVVFSRDIMSIPVDQILSTQVLATAVDGDFVYGSV
ncbi:amidohydrolase family-domain-containing protein [Rhodocollybia butyracea]|uniref:Amidohydrolase family-domain-containing protein n=1 Tax=Rhodocollybia butyracea TaxID=206335 RepID=A0A9P5PW26_9AGAR|nr:amidohydrolase family-domain-containing protein [Rhodocollybia butyracea]